MSPMSYESGIGRRDFFCSGGSAIFGSLVAALLGGAKPARAQTISGNVPEVDRATVRVVTDNYHFALSPSGKIGDVEVGRVVFPLSDQPPGKVLLSEFGLSMHLETQRGDETRNVLIDFGYSSPTLLNNLDILGIDPAKLDAMVLSHGHYDHFGGMVGFLRETQSRNRKTIAASVRLCLKGKFCLNKFCATLTASMIARSELMGKKRTQDRSVPLACGGRRQITRPAYHPRCCWLPPHRPLPSQKALLLGRGPRPFRQGAGI